MRRLLLPVVAVLTIMASCSQPTPPAAQVITVPRDNRKQDFELAEKCGVDARQWFDEFNQSALEAGMLNYYSNHYSPTKNRCYIILEINSFSKAKDGSSVQHYARQLWDVIENRLNGRYNVDANVLTHCELAGATCQSSDEWKVLASPYSER